MKGWLKGVLGGSADSLKTLVLIWINESDLLWIVTSLLSS